MNKLYKNIAEIFNLNIEFVKALFDTWKFPEEYLSLDYNEFVTKISPLQYMYVSFAVTTCHRGQDAYNLITPFLTSTSTKKRYLDVGCGYGGFVKVFAENGYNGTGIEINPMLCNYSKLNCSGLSNANCSNDDFFNIDLSQREPYTVITCNDVIEHVENPEKAIEKMANSLESKGVLMMEIPNRNSINFVQSDGHFQLFGITTLDRFDAGEYYKHVTKADNTNGYLVAMGEYYPLEFYLNSLKNSNMEIHIIERHQIGSLPDYSTLLSNCIQAYNNWTLNTKNTLPTMIRELMDVKFNEYISGLTKSYSECVLTKNYKPFYQKYMYNFWTLIAVKN